MKKLKTAIALTAAAATLAAFSLTASAEAYNGYLCFQTAAYSFRNSYSDTSYGLGTDYFNSVIVWGNNDPETFPEYEDNFDYDIEGYVLPATYTDAVIDGDGTYTVSLDGFDWSADKASSFNTLYVPTDIPLTAGAVISDASIIVDGAVTKTVAAPMQNPDDKEFVQIMFANVWNTDLDSYADAYPTSSLAIEFTVSGLGTTANDEPASDNTAAAPTDTAAGEKGSPDTGVEGVAAFAGAALLAGAVIVMSRKRK